MMGFGKHKARPPGAGAAQPSLVDRFTTFASRPVKLLIVEDDSLDRHLLRTFLKPYNVDITEAVGRHDACELAKVYDYELALVDIRLPSPVDGLLVMEALRQHNPYVPICAFSAQMTPEDMAQICERVGVVIMAPKLIVLDDLFICQLLVMCGLGKRAGVAIADREPK